MALVVVALVWLTSIASVALWSLPPWAAPACALAVCPATLLFRGRHDALVLALAAVLALFGAARFQQWRGSEAPNLAHFISRTVVVDGTIASEPDPGETTTSYNVRVSHVQTFGYSGTTDGMVRLTVGQYDNYLPGDEVRLSGPLEPAPVFDGFNYRDYLRGTAWSGRCRSRKSNSWRQGVPGIRPASLPAHAWLSTGAWSARCPNQRHRSLAASPSAATATSPRTSMGRSGDTGLAHIVAVSGSR